MAARPYRLGLAGVLLVFFFRLLLAVAVIPPWQNPDEPQHFAFVRLLSRQATLDLSSRREDAIEREVLQSMAEHGWWRHYKEPTPSPLPATFFDVPVHLNVVTIFPPVYYVMAAGLLKATGIAGLLDQYYALRWLGIVLALPTLWCMWAGARILFGERVALGAALLVALHPQFALVSIAVNADVLVNLLGAIVWWQAARLVTGRNAAVSVVAMIGATALAAFTKRSAAPLVGITGLVSAYTVFRLAYLQRRRALRVAAVIGAAVVVVVAVACLVPQEAERVASYWSRLLNFSRLARVWDLAFLRDFATGLFDSAWLTAGWLRYPAPFAWLLGARLLVLLAVLGLLFTRWREVEPGWVRGVQLATVFATMYLGGVVVGLYLNAFGAQGRFLFPVIGPWMALMWIGIHAWWPRRLWPWASAALVGLMLLLDFTGWTAVIIPAYVP